MNNIFNGWGKKPTGITIPAAWIESVGRIWWHFGIELHKVRFADHRSGWCGINVGIWFGPWGFEKCFLRWRPPMVWDMPSVYTLQQQIHDTYGKPDLEDTNESGYLRFQMLNKIVEDGIKEQRIQELIEKEDRSAEDRT